MNDIIVLKGLRRRFLQGDVAIDVLRGIDATLPAGRIVALLGPSGSGKSTLLQAVGLLEGGFDGSIVIAGQSVDALDQDARTRVRRERIGFVYQFHHLLPDFSAVENVAMPLLVQGRPHAEAMERAGALLERLGLAQRLDHKPSKLSGGEQQRVAVARALAIQPQLVLADEPTGNLDETTADVVFDQFVALVRDHGSSAIVATHNERLAARMDSIWRLHDGRITIEDRAA